MPYIKIKSIFEHISSIVFEPKQPLNELKTKIITFVESKEINDKDKKLIIHKITTSTSIVRLQAYICNSLLQYEGLGMSQLNSQKDLDG